MSRGAACLAILPLLAMCATAPAGQTYFFSHPSWLAAEVEFNLVDGVTLQVRVKNTSTGAPAGFSNSDQILSSVSWDFGEPGAAAGDPEITGGSVAIGPTSASLNFDTGSYGPGAGVSGEWGYGNAGGSGNLTNFITVNQAHATPFGGDNLTGPESLEGPRAGLVADPILLDVGGLSAVQNEVIATLAISKALDDLDFLNKNSVSIEFGSDAVFVIVPEPWTVTLAGLGLFGFLASLRRRRAAPPA